MAHMRLAFITPGFSASEDDWCIPVLLDLVRVLASEHDVTVFALRYPYHRRPYEVHGARVVPLGGAEIRGLGRLPLFLRTLEAVRGHGPFDVIHAFWAHEPGFLAALAGRLGTTPVVVSLMGGELVRLPEIGYGGGLNVVNRALARGALAGAARVSAASQYQHNLARPQVAPERLVSCPLGVDTVRFRPDGPDGTRRLDGDPKLLSVGSLVPVKDQATLLRAFARVASRFAAARLHIVGDGELRPGLGELAAQLGVASRVHFHDAVPHGELAGLYRQADLAVLASRSEGLPMVILEAAACACPTVGTAVGVLPEILPRIRRVEPGDDRGLTELLFDLLEDREALLALARESLALAQGVYSLGECARRLEELYLELQSC